MRSHRRRVPAFPGRGVFHVVACLAVVLVLGVAAPQQARAAEPEFLTFGIGGYDIDGDDGTVVFNLEFVDDRHWLWKLKPMTGAFATGEGSLYGYAGLALDMYFGRSFVIDLSFAPGLYFEGGGKDLGHVVEFRSSIKAAWRFEDESRLGVEFFHLSNAGLDDRNPGANQLMLFYSIPFER